jgi:hypothetical protein
MRGKILDYKYVYNPNSSSDSNSFIIFAPSFATPLIVSAHASAGSGTQLLYKPMKGNSDLNSTNPSLLLLTGIGGGKCKDFFGNSLANNYALYPDSKIGNYYGLKFVDAQTTGDVFFKTIVYSPVTDSYSIVPIQGTSLYSLAGSYADLVELSGITGMSFNDEKNNAYIKSVNDLFSGVKNGEICSANLGNRVVFFWNENNISNETGPNNQSLSSREDSLSADCIQ